MKDAFHRKGKHNNINCFVGNNLENNKHNKSRQQYIPQDEDFYFSVRLARDNNPILLRLTSHKYKVQFREFVRKFQLTKEQAIALKEIVKERLAQLLQKESKQNKDKASYEQQQIQRITEKECEESSVYERVEYEQQEEQDDIQSDQDQDLEQSPSHQTNKSEDQADYLEIQSPNNLHSSIHKKITMIPAHSKKLFCSQMSGRESYNFPQNSIISSIHENQGDEQKQEHKVNNNQVHTQNQYQSQQQHVSFQDFQNNNKITDNKRQFKQQQQIQDDDMPTGMVNKRDQQQYQDYFTLDRDKPTQIMRKEKSVKDMKFTPIKSNNKSPLSSKKTKLQEGIKMQKNDKLRVESGKKKKKQKILSRAKQKQNSISSKKEKHTTLQRFNKQLDERQLNHHIFYRLYYQETASSRQRLRPQVCKSSRQLQDQRVIFQSQEYQRQKYRMMTPLQKQQLFTKLYMSSTESSMNKKYDPTINSSYSNQIQNIISQSAHQHTHSPSRNKQKPNLSSPVYQSSSTKRCNEHCQQFQYEKKLSQQKQKSKEREKHIRQQVRLRSKDSLSTRSPTRVKKSGQCPCCHKQSIEQKEKRSKQLQRRKNKSYTSSTKYSLQKLFLPPNISFISDVLEESYNELFPSK